MKKMLIGLAVLGGVLLLTAYLYFGVPKINEMEKQNRIRAENNPILQDQLISEALGGVPTKEFLYERSFFQYGGVVTYKGNKYRASFKYDDDGNILGIEKFVLMKESKP